MLAIIQSAFLSVRLAARRPTTLRAFCIHSHYLRHRSDFVGDLDKMASTTIESMKERMAALGSQVRAIKQGGATSSTGEGSLESIQAELKDLKAKLAKAEKDQKAELEKNKIQLKVPKVRSTSLSCLRPLCTKSACSIAVTCN